MLYRLYPIQSARPLDSAGHLPCSRMPGHLGLPAERDALVLLLALLDDAVLRDAEEHLGAQGLGPRGGLERSRLAEGHGVSAVQDEPARRAAVGGIRGRLQVTAVVAIHRNEPRRVPGRAVQEEAALESAGPGTAPAAEREVPQPVVRVVAPALLPLPVEREHSAACLLPHSAPQPAADVAVARGLKRPGPPGGVRGRERFDDAAEGEVAVERARRTVDDAQRADGGRREDAPVGVPLHVAVERQIDRHAVDDEEDVGRMVGGEPADDGVRREAGALALLVDLDPGRTAHHVVGRGRRRAAQHFGSDLDRGDRRGHGLLPAPGDRDRCQLRHPCGVGLPARLSGDRCGKRPPDDGKEGERNAVKHEWTISARDETDTDGLPVRSCYSGMVSRERREGPERREAGVGAVGRARGRLRPGSRRPGSSPQTARGWRGVEKFATVLECATHSQTRGVASGDRPVVAGVMTVARMVTSSRASYRPRALPGQQLGPRRSRSAAGQGGL